MGTKKYDGSCPQPGALGAEKSRASLWVTGGTFYHADSLIRVRERLSQGTGYSVEYPAPAINKPGPTITQAIPLEFIFFKHPDERKKK